MGDEDQEFANPCKCMRCNRPFDRAAGRLIVVDSEDDVTCFAAYLQQTSDTELCWTCILGSIRTMSDDRFATIA